MTRWFIFGLIGALATASCSGAQDGGDDEKEVVLECGDERGDLGALDQAIVNGDPSFDPEVVVLTPGQVLAVGAIMMRYGGDTWENGCTGTLVAPDAVLTAAHCVERWGGVMPASALRFGMGEDVADGQLVGVREVRVHPGYDRRTGRHDVAVLVLERDAREVVPEIVSLPYNCLTLGASDLAGEHVQTVGYGCIDSNCGQENTRRWWAVQEVVAVSTFDFTVDGYGVSGVCFGDSGGPALYTMPGGEVRVLGTLHGGDPDCGNRDHFPSTFDSCAFIDTYAGGCGEETQAGRCKEDTLIYCDETVVVTLDCSLHEKTCGDDGTGLMACVDAPEPEPDPDPDPEPDACQGVDATGYCEGDSAIWCENGRLMERRCGECMQECGYVEDVGYYCI